MASLILAHGPIGGALALGLGIVVAWSLLIALSIWLLSRPGKLSSPNGLAPLILITGLTLLVNCISGLVWLFTEWTIAGRYAGAPPGLLLLLLVTLPSIVGGAAYVAWRRCGAGMA